VPAKYILKYFLWSFI